MKDDLVSCKNRTANLEAELFQLKNKYKNFLNQKENIQNDNTVKEEPIMKEAKPEKEPEKVVLDFRIKMETLKILSKNLENELSRYNCILEVDISGHDEEG